MMSDGIGKHLNIFLIKNILSEIWIDNQKNFNDLTASSKYNDLVNFNNKINVDDENSVDTNIKVINENITPTNSRSNFSNLISNNRLNSFTQESVYNGNYNALHQMEDEWDDFENEHKERQLEEMLIIENKSFLKNKISEKEKKATSNPTSNLVKNSSFITRCTKQRPMVCYDYLCKTRSPSFKRVELLTPAKEKKWLEDYKMELQFLQENFSEVLPEILYDVVRKRVTDPVHYIVHYLIKYKVDNFKNDNIIYKPLY